MHLKISCFGKNGLCGGGMKIWKDKEVKDLFCAVEECKSGARPLCEAFKKHAKAYGRKPNSVRNYYYKDVENLKADKARVETLQIDLSRHVKNHFKCFDKDEERALLQKIDEMKTKGVSVREACKRLSEGDLSKMTRLQNKYQNMKRQTAKQDNVVVFQKKQKLLTDADMNGLVLGVVKLVKKMAIEEYEQKRICEEGQKEREYSQMIELLNKREAELEILTRKLQNLKVQGKENVEHQTMNEKLKKHLQNKKTEKENQNCQEK